MSLQHEKQEVLKIIYYGIKIGMAMYTKNIYYIYYTHTHTYIYTHPAYLTYAEYIMQNARLNQSEARIKIVRKISTPSDM